MWLLPLETTANRGRSASACRHTGRRTGRRSLFHLRATALRDGIAAVAVGKHGARPIPPELVTPLLQQLEQVQNAVDSVGAAAAAGVVVDATGRLAEPWAGMAQRASFLASLFLKSHILEHESELLQWCVRLVQTGRPAAVGRERHGCYASDVLQVLCPSLRADCDAYRLAVRLLSGEYLSTAEARQVARVVLDEPDAAFGDVGTSAAAASHLAFQALVLHSMRVRHETAEELLGMAQAMNDVVAPAFRQAPPGARFVQLAEPFDGFERAGTCLLTPLLAAQLQRRWGLAPVVAAVSDTAGPKYGPNLKQVLMELQRGEQASTPPGERVPTAHTLDEVYSGASSEPIDAAPLLTMVDQRDVCPPLHALAPLRRTIQKRPGWSTVEKYVNGRPETCGLLIASAFHPPYTDRMIEVAIGLGLPAAIVVRKGLEGSLTVSHKSTVELACCARLPDGTYERTEMKIEPPGPRIPEEERFRRPLTAAENAALLREYLRYGRCADSAYFTSLVQATLGALDEALQWVLARVQPLEAAPSAPTTVESSVHRQ